MSRNPALLLLVAALLVHSACSGGGEPAPAQPDPIPCPQLGVQLAQIPSGLRLVANDDDGLRLAPAAEGVSGLLVVSLEPAAEGVNLVAAVQEHQAAIEAAEGGSYLGAQELVGPLGVTFWSRGRFRQDEGLLEETIFFALHPSGQRILTATYRYPAGDDSSQRVQQALDLMGELGPISGS
jgi:hypothetical protein